MGPLLEVTQLPKGMEWTERMGLHVRRERKRRIKLGTSSKLSCITPWMCLTPDMSLSLARMDFPVYRHQFTIFMKKPDLLGLAGRWWERNGKRLDPFGFTQNRPYPSPVVPTYRLPKSNSPTSPKSGRTGHMRRLWRSMPDPHQNHSERPSLPTWVNIHPTQKTWQAR